MRKYREKKKKREQQQMLHADLERREIAAKKREAAKRKAQQARSLREKEKKINEKKKQAVVRTKAWRLKVKISNNRLNRSSPNSSHQQKENPFSSRSAEKRAVKRASDALPNTPIRKKRIIEKLAGAQSDSQNVECTRSRKRLPLEDEVIQSLQEEIHHLKPKGGSNTHKKAAYNAILHVASKIKVRYGLKTSLKDKLKVRRLATKNRYWENKARKKKKIQNI